MAIDELESLARREFDLIFQTIYTFWARSSIAQSYKDTLWETMSRLSPVADGFSKNHLFILLPRLSYQACGGKDPFLNEISSAWYLCYLAADLMDSVQDQDIQIAFDGKRLSSAEILNIASGFYFTANSLLVELLDRDCELKTIRSILHIFQSKLLEMGEGQQQDVANQEISLTDYLNLLRKKSGSFFSLACTAGARMAVGSSSQLEGLSTFGSHLGCIIQILDDLEDWHQIHLGNFETLRRMDWYKNLPAIYTLEVLPSEEKVAFRNLIEKLANQSNEWNTYVSWVNRTGAALYTMTLLTQEVELAKQALHHDWFHEKPRESLLMILDILVGEI